MAATSQKRSGTTDLTVGKPLFQILRFALTVMVVLEERSQQVLG